MPRKSFQQKVNEQTTARISGTLKDHAGAVLTSGGANDVTTLVLTLYDKKSGTIINSRSAQSILNVNGGSLDSAGLFALALTPLDNVLVDATLQEETHIALVEWTYPTAQGGSHEFFLKVRNLRKKT